jgi:diadenosine tetraphosphate (Ap4A) HIT family hydrolase
LSDFALDPRIAADTLHLAELTLCTVRLKLDANFSWLLVIPRIAYTTEIVDLTPEHRHTLMEDVVRTSAALREVVACDKLNIASFGNAVSQIHVHVIARLLSDVAWPKPVWGAAPAKEYAEGEAEALAAKLKARLK